MKKCDRFEQLSKLLEESPEVWIGRRLDRLYDIIVINGENFIDLYELIKTTRGEEARSIWLARKDIDKKEFFRKLLRPLLNYLGSSYALYEHTKKLVKKHYIGTQVESGYNDLVSEYFKGNTLNCFVEDLRSYFTHYAIPVLALNFNSNINNECVTQIYLLKDRLMLQNFNWRRLSNVFLKTLPDGIEFADIIFQFQKLRDEFYGKFRDILENHHKNETEQVNTWGEEYNELLKAMRAEIVRHANSITTGGKK